MLGLIREAVRHNPDEVVPPGTVTLIGGGPGDPELITLAGLKALFAADVVLADHLGPVNLLDELGEDVEVIDVAKHPRGKSVAQDTINDIMVQKAKAGQRVVRLKGGEGFVFGRGYEEVTTLREEGIVVRVIPGLTSPVTVPVLAGIPITARGLLHDFTVISGHVPPGDPSSLVNWNALSRMTGTLIFLMAVHNIGAIAEFLVNQGKAADTPAAIVIDGSLPTQRVVRTTLGALGQLVEDEAIRPPAIFVIGDVAGLE